MNAHISNLPEPSKADHMFHYIAQRRAVFPLTAKRTPMRRGWKETPIDPTFVDEDFPFGYGVVLNETDLVVDYDPRRDETGNQLSDLLRTIGIELSDTYVVKTPRGGMHVYFKTEAGRRFRSDLKASGQPAIEIKSHGRYVVGPGSPAGSDQRNCSDYAVMYGKYADRAEAPEVLLQMCERQPAPAPVQTIIIDDDATIERFRRFCREAEPAIEDQGGNNQTFKVACNGRDYGLPAESTFAVMEETYNSRCSPPWDVEQLRTIVDNAYRYASGTMGNSHPAADFAETDITEYDGNDRASPGITLISATELLRGDYGDPHWAVQPILPEGFTVLAGAPKIGKSWLALDLCLAIASGTNVFGRYQAQAGSAIYLALEDNYRRIKDRLLRLATTDAASAHFDRLKIACASPRMHEGAIAALGELLDQNPDCRLLIIDTQARIAPPPRKNMNAYENDSLVWAKLQALAMERRIAVLIITHLRKKEAGDPFEQVMGSTGITGVADAIWLIKRGRCEDSGVLSITGRDVEEQEIALQFDRSTLRWRSLGSAVSHRLSEDRQSILRILEEAGEPMSTREVAEALSRKPGNIKSLMHKMFRDHQLVRTAPGKYRPATASDDFGNLNLEGSADEVSVELPEVVTIGI